MLKNLITSSIYFKMRITNSRDRPKLLGFIKYNILVKMGNWHYCKWGEYPTLNMATLAKYPAFQ